MAAILGCIIRRNFKDKVYGYKLRLKIQALLYVSGIRLRIKAKF
jgi:hypothetical protein